VAQSLFGRAEWVLRLPLALFGTANVALVFAFRRQLGAGACALAALAMAISPGAVFYSRYAIHETAFVFFLMLATWGLLTWHRSQEGEGWLEAGVTHRWAAALGLTGAVLTKETYVVHFAALAFGIFCLWPEWRHASRGAMASANESAALVAVCAGLIVFFYSGGFLHWPSLAGLVLTFVPWLETGTSGESGHEKGWWYWLSLLGRYEWPALLGLIAAPWLAWRGSSLATRGLALTSLAALTVYSVIAYKTPWCLAALMWPWHLVFGVAVVHVWREWDRWLAALLAAPALALSLSLSLDLNFHKFTDETEPYVYVQTLPAIDRVLGPLRALVARDPLARHLEGHVVMSDIHPLPWLLGDFTHIDFPEIDDLPEPLDAPFLLIDDLLAEEIEPHLHAAYFREPLQIRGMDDGTALLYLRVAEFRDLFPDRTPEFVPERSAP
jgi:4-amino-4-deoxy-L-arabinose transferase-like glycosyltransferase